MKEVPVLYTSKDSCCGCTACYAVCPQHAISMNPDEEGFLYPGIDEAKCIRCFKCVKVCVFKSDLKEKRSAATSLLNGKG